MLWAFIIMVSIATVATVWCQIAVAGAAWGRLYSDVDKIPHREVGLLLGTSPIGRNGNPNSFFLRRIDAAEALYKHGKIDRFILSGTKRETPLSRRAGSDEKSVDRKRSSRQHSYPWRPRIPNDKLRFESQGVLQRGLVYYYLPTVPQCAHVVSGKPHRNRCHRLQCCQHTQPQMEISDDWSRKPLQSESSF